MIGPITTQAVTPQVSAVLDAGVDVLEKTTSFGATVWIIQLQTKTIDNV